MAWAASKCNHKASFLDATLNHDEATPLTVLFAVLVLSLMYRTPESMGEEMVQSIIEGGVAPVESESVLDVGTESKTREAAESGTLSVTVRVVDSGVELWAMSVTGRMVELGAVVLTGGVEESSEGIWLESVGKGETVTAGEAGVGGRLSCTGGVGESARVA